MSVSRIQPLPTAHPGKPRLRILLPLALPVAVLAGFAMFFVLSPLKTSIGPPPGKPGALVWGDAIFANSAELRAWMKSHGGDYSAWLLQHPAAARLLEGHSISRIATGKREKAVAAARRPKKRAPRHGVLGARATVTTAAAAAPAARPTDVAVTAPVGTTSRYARPLTILLWVLAALALLTAMLPARLVVRDGVIQPWISNELRWLLAASGLGILGGAVVVLLIG